MIYNDTQRYAAVGSAAVSSWRSAQKFQGEIWLTQEFRIIFLQKMEALAGTTVEIEAVLDLAVAES